VLCIALISAAYVRVFVPGASAVFAPEARPAKKQLPIYRVDRDDRTVALSFDAAWGDEKTEGILKILEERGIRSTFFLVGYWVDAYPEKVKLIHEAGHEIGNHTSTHPYLSNMTGAQIAEELRKCSDKIQALTGVSPTLLRPPYGDYDDEAITAARAEGYEVIQWDVDSLDWKNRGVQPIVDQVMGKVQPGSIVLFHNNSDHILKALPAVLDQLEAQGYSVVPVSEILLQGETMIDVAGCQHKVGQ
jgi:polysaccharide deacetylase family sporulation protein PdaB